MSKSKVNSEQFNVSELYASALDLPPDISADLKKEGLSARWINATEFQKSYGFHKSRWTPYKRKVDPKKVSQFGGDPEAYVRRGDLILATKPSEEHAKHAKLLKVRTAMATKGSKEGAETLRELSRAHGVKAKIDENYENPGESADDEE